ncbi:hypothetical protein ABFA07_022531 [Porites harrisoni]
MNSSTSVNGTVLTECIFHTLFGGRLHQPSYSTQAVIIFTAVINAIASPITVVLNALLIIAMKRKPRLRAHKSNILLALPASTDLVVGLILQPTFIAMITTVVQSKSGFCTLTDAFRHCAGCLVSASLTHLALISMKRYLAIKHPFIYDTIVTEAHLLFASTLAWLLSIFLQISIVFGETLYFTIKTTCQIVIVSFTILCHLSVYRETNRHERHVAAHQVTKEAREKFQKDKKALKITSIVLGTLLICYTPLTVSRMTLSKYRYEISLNAAYTAFVFFATVALLNSFINPVIYSVRLRQFRVAIIELICRNVSVVEAEQIEKRLFGRTNAISKREAVQDHKGTTEESAKEANTDNAEKCNQQNGILQI